MCDIRFEVFQGVYPPSEDTWMLMDCIREYPRRALEVCCGPGLISLKLAEGGTRTVAVDIDPRACINTEHNARINGLNHIIDVVCSDLCSPLRGKFDVVFCNPPYLPFDDALPERKWWFGGKGGVEIACRLIRQAQNILVKGGKMFLVVSSLSDVPRLYLTLEENGFGHEIIRSKDFDSERIMVVRATLARS